MDAESDDDDFVGPSLALASCPYLADAASVEQPAGTAVGIRRASESQKAPASYPPLPDFIEQLSRLHSHVSLPHGCSIPGSSDSRFSYLSEDAMPVSSFFTRSGFLVVCSTSRVWCKGPFHEHEHEHEHVESLLDNLRSSSFVVHVFRRLPEHLLELVRTVQCLPCTSLSAIFCTAGVAQEDVDVAAVSQWNHDSATVALRMSFAKVTCNDDGSVVALLDSFGRLSVLELPYVPLMGSSDAPVGIVSVLVTAQLPNSLFLPSSSPNSWNNVTLALSGSSTNTKILLGMPAGPIHVISVDACGGFPTAAGSSQSYPPQIAADDLTMVEGPSSKRRKASHSDSSMPEGLKLCSLHTSAVMFMKYLSSLQSVVSCDISGRIELWSDITTKSSLPGTKLAFPALFFLVKSKPVSKVVGFTATSLPQTAAPGSPFARCVFLCASKTVCVVDIDVSRKPTLSAEFVVPELWSSHSIDDGATAELSISEDGRYVFIPDATDVLVCSLSSKSCVHRFELSKLKSVSGQHPHDDLCAVSFFSSTVKVDQISIASGVGSMVYFGENAGEDSKLPKEESFIVARSFQGTSPYLWFLTSGDRPPLPRPFRTVASVTTAMGWRTEPFQPESSSIKRDFDNDLAVRSATLHTTKGDIVLELYPSQTPLTVTNFVRLAKSRKYDGCPFHRIVRGFMIQTGDYEHRDGSGGQSCWGGEFDDEIRLPMLNHSDHPFMVSMANRSVKNSNGSQFFITTAKSHGHLDGKHTVFGRVIKGQDVVMDIEKIPSDKRDHPKEDVFIMSVSLKFQP
eukprot:ANDGO_05542.mRNA.1 Peptidyl-prolyl cis-trans isomerase CYP71